MEKANTDVSMEAVTRMAARLVSAYVSNNVLATGELAGLIQTIYASLHGLENGGVPDAAVVDPLKPAVPLKKSVTPDYIVCLEDGKKLKMLKRHLRSTYGLTPDEYRTKWGLAPEYPMVAPNYAAQRSAFAKEIGLGRGPGQTPAARARQR